MINVKMIGQWVFSSGKIIILGQNVHIIVVVYSEHVNIIP